MIGLDPQKSGTTPEPSREILRRTRRSAVTTALPRWARQPAAGVADYQTQLSDELVQALRRLAHDVAVPLSSVWLTAHAKVLSALSGEREISTGYVAAPGRSPLIYRTTTASPSWRAMLLATDRGVSELRSQADLPVDDARSKPSLWTGSFETVFELAAAQPTELPDCAVLWVGIVERDGVELQLRYRAEILDAEYAERIAGYYRTALELIAADPDAEHQRQSLVSAEEVHFQVHALAGPRRQLPDRRVHELFEERAQAHSDAIAAVHRDTQWTYGELNRRANRLARGVLSRGVRSESVVAVVTERNLDWMASVLAILKAGGAYMPIDPTAPADRIASMLSRSGCRLVLTEPGCSSTLASALDALPGVHRVDINGLYQTIASDDNPGIAVGPDQLAYIYFTSGSSGEPKGVMCEHGGMLNHICAKIHDLGIGQDHVVAQIAPQCFDISLWQLLSAIVAGGRTLIVEQDAILDARRFVDRIAASRVAVLQVVPSYLEVLLAHLTQQPCDLPDVRYVSVTGEALKKELVQRWFATQPAIKLVNAYGLTETSDDTNHEVMDRAPDRERVPLGSPISNVNVYVVDEHLTPVPLGAPGEIVFSGVCVGRGYVNDPIRTRQAFMADPHRKNQRLYRSGDYGRWLPDGKLEFLGRRDTQVKVSGFRIELGEIENALLRWPGVRAAAVVVAGQADPSTRLVAFYSGERPVEASMLRDMLSRSLPEYMIPAAFHWRTSLTLTRNGKVDRNALTALVAEIDHSEPDSGRPSTSTEHRLAEAWAVVLGMPKDRIGRQDHFFDLGGTSLSALKLAIALDRAVSITDLSGHPILADLATLIDLRREARSA